MSAKRWRSTTLLLQRNVTRIWLRLIANRHQSVWERLHLFWVGMSCLEAGWLSVGESSKKQISPVTRQPLIYFKRRLPSYFYSNWLSLKNISLTFAFLLILPSVFLTAWCSAVFTNKPTLSCVVCESDKLRAKQSTGVWIKLWAIRGSKKPQSFSVGCNYKRFFIMHLCTFPLP